MRWLPVLVITSLIMGLLLAALTMPTAAQADLGNPWEPFVTIDPGGLSTSQGSWVHHNGTDEIFAFQHFRESTSIDGRSRAYWSDDAGATWTTSLTVDNLEDRFGFGGKLYQNTGNNEWVVCTATDDTNKQIRSSADFKTWTQIGAITNADRLCSVFSMDADNQEFVVLVSDFTGDARIISTTDAFATTLTRTITGVGAVPASTVVWGDFGASYGFIVTDLAEINIVECNNLSCSDSTVETFDPGAPRHFDGEFGSSSDEWDIAYCDISSAPPVNIERAVTSNGVAGVTTFQVASLSEANVCNSQTFTFHQKDDNHFVTSGTRNTTTQERTQFIWVGDGENFNQTIVRQEISDPGFESAAIDIDDNNTIHLAARQREDTGVDNGAFLYTNDEGSLVENSTLVFVAEPLPEGWSSPEGDNTDPTFLFPGAGEPRGVSITSARDNKQWFLSVGSEDPSRSIVNLLHTKDDFQSFRIETLREVAGDVSVGGMSFKHDRIAGCWTEHEDGTSARVRLFWLQDGFNSTRDSTFSTDMENAQLCSTGQARDAPSRGGTSDMAVMWGAEPGVVKWFLTGTESASAKPGQGVELPGRSAFGTDMLMLTQAENEDARVSYRVFSISVGDTQIPFDRSQVFIQRASSLRPVAVTEAGPQFFNDPIMGRMQADFVAGDVAISSPVHGMAMWHDRNRDQVRIAVPIGIVGTIEEVIAFNMTENVNWLRLVSAGQGGYVGVLTTSIGNVYAFETQDGGATWEIDRIANDAVVPVVSDRRFTADAMFDHTQDLFVVAWAIESGIRIAVKEVQVAIAPVDSERSFREFRADERVQPATEFIGINLSPVAEQLGMSTTMFRGLIAVALLTALTVIMHAWIGRFDWSVGLVGGIGLPMLLGIGLIDPWIFLTLLLGAALLFVFSFRRQPRGDAI